jgi:hypothetical protein
MTNKTKILCYVFRHNILRCQIEANLANRIPSVFTPALRILFIFLEMCGLVMVCTGIYAWWG